ncbi:hypothetical protein CR51_36240 [Caballeronia megalochromosomata]|jgi:phage tail-like protein|nr:hypothetical protein CR51_36240 [Caballeronia megalochromosomata]
MEDHMAEDTATDAPQSAGPAGNDDPCRDYNFRVQVGQDVMGYFYDCIGPSMRVHKIPYREGGSAYFTRSLPGPVDPGDVTLTYGMTRTSDLWEWFMNTVKGKRDRRLVNIIMLGNDGASEAYRYVLSDAWITEWAPPKLSTLGRNIAIHSLTIACDAVDLKL